MKIKNSVLPLFRLLSALVLLALIPTSSVLAAKNKSDLQAIVGNTVYYKDRLDCSSVDSAVQTSTGKETPKWVTTLSAPFSLEDFAVEALRALAQKEGVPETSTVTQEHVLFFVAYAHREGGNLTNTSLYNPWNTGYTGPDLKPINHNTGGAQAYSSFNDGVEAYARVFSGTSGSSGYQSRMGTILSKPASTATDIANTLVYYKPYAGNLAWAAASEEPNAASYLKSVNDAIQTVRSHYASEASYLVGPPGNSARANLHSPHPLRYQFTGDTSTNPGGSGSSSADSSSQCICPASGSNTIVIDPGHSGSPTSPNGRILGYDYPNHPEMEDVFDVAQQVKAKLTEAGYQVIMTKSAAADSIGLKERADIANTNNAALALSIHDQAGASGGMSFANQNNYIYPQYDGLYRIDENGQKITFSNPDVSSKSQQYSAIFAEQRSAAEGHTVSVLHDPGEQGGRDHAPGNMWTVQLFSKVPWVYNEAGGNSVGQVGLNASDKQKYADGLVAAVEKSVPIDTASASGPPQTTNCSSTNGAVAGNIAQTAVNFSWPSDQGLNKKPEYLKAMQQFNPGIPFGGADAREGGADCGGFVATVMRASGADPNYPLSGTGQQEKYVRAHPEKYAVVDSVSSTADLQPGDILIVNKGSGSGADGHTYIYVGPQPNKTNAASASFHKRMASLGTAILSDSRGNYMRARLK